MHQHSNYRGPQRRQWQPTPVLLPGNSHGRKSLVGCSPWGRWELDMTQWLDFHFSLSCTGEGNGNPLQCSCLENPRDGGGWWAAVSGVAQSRTRLKRLSSLACKNWLENKSWFIWILIVFEAEKAMAQHSSTLAWKIPWTEEPGGLQSMGSPRVGDDWVTWLSLFTFMHWRRKWQPTPVFLPGESQGRGSLVGCRLWGRTELDTTEAT